MAHKKRTKSVRAAKNTSQSSVGVVAVPVAPATPALATRLPSAWKLSRSALAVLRDNWKIFAGITLIYIFFQLFLVRSFGEIGDRTAIQQLFSSGSGALLGGIGSLVLLVGSSGSGSNAGSGAYGFFAVIIVSLALVWALRKIASGASKLRIRDAFYQGMYPLIPVTLVFLVICLEAIPLLFAGSLYVTFIAGGIAVVLIEKILVILAIVLLAGLSLYLISSSIFALYIATLPDTAPVKALRSANRLVKYRRLSLIRKLLFLPASLFVALAIIIVPVAIYLRPIAPWLFFVLSTPLLAYVHTYLYLLYTELLPE